MNLQEQYRNSSIETHPKHLYYKKLHLNHRLKINHFSPKI